MKINNANAPQQLRNNLPASVLSLTLFILLLLVSSLLGRVQASPLIGTWQGELVVTPQTKVVVQFIFAKDDAGNVTGVLNAPDESNLRNIPASSLSFADNALTLEVDEVGGVFVGNLLEGKLTGKWTQQFTDFPLVLEPFVKKPLSEEALALITGTWTGTLNIPRTARKLDVVFHIEANAEKHLMASLDSPDQSLSGISFDEVSFRGNNLRMKVLDPEMSYHGVVKGTGIVGEWTQGGSAPLNMSKGEYQAKGLDIDEAVRARLRGQWFGQLGSAITVVFRFQDNANGEFGAYLDSPDQGRNNVPVSAITLEGEKLLINIDGFDSVFSGTLIDGVIKGDMKQGDQINVVTMKRGVYVAPKIELPNAIAEQLMGNWEGIAGNTKLVFRFMRKANNELQAVLDIPSERLYNLPLSDFKTDGNKLQFIVKGIGGEFDGEIKPSTSEVTGQWNMPGFQFPLQLKPTAQ